MAINWGLAQQPNAFDRAFEQGFQRGEYVRQRQEQEAQRNALADYARSPTPDGLNALAQYAPEFVLQQRQQQAAAQQRQVTDQREQLPVIGRLLANATPENWGQMVATAQQYGLNVSDVPQQFDPAWRDRTMAFVQAMQTPEGQQQISGIARELQDAGYEYGSPDFEEAMSRAIAGKYSTEYVDAEGNTRRAPGITPPQQGGQQFPNAPRIGAVEDGYRYRGGDPANPQSWEQAGQMSATQGPPVPTTTPEGLGAMISVHGADQVQRWMQSGQLSVRNR